MKRAIESLRRTVQEDWAETTNELLILSNSNSMFIELVLKHHGLWSLFDGAVITNPARWDPANPDRLLLHRRVDPKDTPHGCTVGCSANMCKGLSSLASFPFSTSCLLICLCVLLSPPAQPPS
jgi:pyridoxal phosphate phosphatase PHOSPHO2